MSVCFFNGYYSRCCLFPAHQLQGQVGIDDELPAVLRDGAVYHAAVLDALRGGNSPTVSCQIGVLRLYMVVWVIR